MTKEEFLPFIQKEGKRCLVVILSSIVLSIGIAWFIDAAGLYSGGIPGISQIIRTVFSRFFQIELRAAENHFQAVIDVAANHIL